MFAWIWNTGNMIAIAYAPYYLQAHKPLNAVSFDLRRHGALLRVTFSSGSTGYADCFAWPELGDLALEGQLESLRKGIYTPVTKSALEWAFLDAQARVEKKSLLEDKIIPKSHFLTSGFAEWSAAEVTDIISQGYTHVKLKIGAAIDRESEAIQRLFSQTPLLLRLDCNESLSLSVFRDFLRKIETVRGSIDFIEDPFPFDPESWSAIQKEGWTLACDRKARLAVGKKESASVLIFKPAIELLHDWTNEDWTNKQEQKIIVTSYLGHPLGQLAAAYAACLVDPAATSVHGLLSHRVYTPTSFSSQLNWEGPEFTMPTGIGFGFTGQLEQLEWKKLICL